MASGGWVAELDKKEQKLGDGWLCAEYYQKRNYVKNSKQNGGLVPVPYFRSSASVTSTLRLRTVSTKVRHVRHLGNGTETSPQVRATEDLLGQQ